MKQSHIEREKRTIKRIVCLYCQKKEKNKGLCPSCKSLIEYAFQRLDYCPFGERKPSCKSCSIHCYEAVKREQIRQIMRYIAPRMIYLAPADFIEHLFRK